MGVRVVRTNESWTPKGQASSPREMDRYTTNRRRSRPLLGDGLLPG